MLAAEYARQFGIEGQGEGESDMAFKSRVSGELRRGGHVIEAHEAYNDAFFDRSEDVITGLLGFVAQQMQGRDYGRDGASGLGDDVASGHIVKHPQKDEDEGVVAIAAMLKMALGG